MNFLGVMDSNSASVDRAETVNNKMEEEMDESLLDETKEVSVAKVAAPANAGRPSIALWCWIARNT